MIAQINVKTKVSKYFDIRKLSTRECFRLMGCADPSIDKIQQSGVSPSAQYKLAGNSIVVDVLFHIFRKIWYAESEPASAAPQQLSLFPDEPWRVDVPKTANVITLCSGYDAQCLALDRLAEWSARLGHGDRLLDPAGAAGQEPVPMTHLPMTHPMTLPPFAYDLLAWAEFDPESNRPLDQQPAVVAHNAIYPAFADRNLGDMTAIDWQAWYAAQGQPDIDLLTYSTPCQSISQAGKREGIAEGSGTRSSILWNTADCVKVTRPRFLLQENVAALVNQENKPHFDRWRSVLSDLGYDTDYRILNARDYGVPQNRDRVFSISWRRDLRLPREFPWPQPQPLTRCIADVLEDDAPEALFLKPESVTAFLTKNQQDGEQYIYTVTDHKLSPAEVEQALTEQMPAVVVEK